MYEIPHICKDYMHIHVDVYLYLVCLHPNNANQSYQRIKVLDLQKEVKDLFDLRKKMLSKELKSELVE